MNLKQRLHSKTSFTPSRRTLKTSRMSRYSSDKQTASPLSSQGFSMGLQLGFDQRITENLYRNGYGSGRCAPGYPQYTPQ